MIDIVSEAKKLQPDIVCWRRYLHQIPEVGLELPKTAAYVAERLKEIGIEYKTGVGVSGIVGIIKGEKPGKVIGLRADMDALAIKEEADISFIATNGNMHACGHDTHTAMLLEQQRYCMRIGTRYMEPSSLSFSRMKRAAMAPRL